MKRQLIISIVGFVLIIGLGFVAFKVMTSGNTKEPITQNFEVIKYVNVLPAEYSIHQFRITTSGRLIAKNSIEIYSEVQGMMKSVSANFKVGSSFKKGDILLSIDDEEFRLQLLTQKSDYLNLLTLALPDIKSDFQQSFSKWSNFIEKYDIHKPIPDLPEYDNSKEKYFLANRKILGQYYMIKNQELRLEKYLIKAPFDGTVTASMIEPGTLVRPGQKLGEYSGNGTYELELSLNPNDAEFINVGSSVKVFLADGISTGSIIRKSSNMDPATQTVKAYLQLSGSNFSEGMYLKAEILGKNIPNSIVIPRKAIINNQFVFIDDNGKLGKKEIEILALGSEDAYISGVEEGAYIISEPVVNPTLGMKIVQIGQ